MRDDDATATPRSLLDLPDELLLEIMVKFKSVQTYKALLHTSKSIRKLLRQVIVVINDTDVEEIADDGLVHFELGKISIEHMHWMIHRYDFFVFNLSCRDGIMDTIRLMKIMLKRLQSRKIYHSITINNNHSSSSISNNPLIRFLLPRMNSPYTEFSFPRVRTINGFDDLRLLDNTNCYFDQLVRLTIGSFSFQLFNLNAPYLEIMNYSDQLKKRAFNESVSASKISYSNFLSNLTFTKNLKLLEIVNRVDPSTLNRFQNLRVLRIYGDHITKSFKLDFFANLKELVITKCYVFEEIWNLKKENLINENLEVLDLSNNKCFHQSIRGTFLKLRELNLSNTNITELPQFTDHIVHNYKTPTHSHIHSTTTNVIVDGCKNLETFTKGQPYSFSDDFK